MLFAWSISTSHNSQTPLADVTHSSYHADKPYTARTHRAPSDMVFGVRQRGHDLALLHLSRRRVQSRQRPVRQHALRDDGAPAAGGCRGRPRGVVAEPLVRQLLTAARAFYRVRLGWNAQSGG